MTLRIAALLFAGLVAVGCSKGATGEQGPKGDAGPTGDTGPRGDPGQPGQSVLSAQLDAGSQACPHGGSQFVSVSGTTYACNGGDGASVTVASVGPGAACANGGTQFSNGVTTSYACNGEPGQQGIPGLKGDKGDKGDPGQAAPPAVLVVDATGATVGQFLSYLAVVNLTGSYSLFVIAETWGAHRVIVERNSGGMINTLFDQMPRYALPNCQGDAFTATGPTSRVLFDNAAARYFVANGAAQTVQIQSYYQFQNPGGVLSCVNIGPTPSTEVVRPRVYLLPPAEYVGPLDLLLP